MQINLTPVADFIAVRPGLFLDLDGTVRYSVSGKFINKPTDIALFDGVESKLWEYRDAGYLIFGISNQGGVAFNIKSPLEEQAEILITQSLFQRDPFHRIETCWFHENGKHPVFGHRSLLRKPDIGLLVLCERQALYLGYVVDWKASILVGDRPEDQQCAERARIAFQWAWQFFGRPEPVEDVKP